jgi:hypothetical protein
MPNNTDETETITVDRQALWQMVCEHSARVAEAAYKGKTLQGAHCADDFMEKNFPMPNVGESK